MKLKYLLDTNIVSEPLKANPSSNVINRMEAEDTCISICSPVWHELNYGMKRLERSRKKELIRDYLENVVDASIPILPYDSESAGIHAAFRAKSESRGRQLPFVDSQIASIAKANNLILVTRNTGDFKGIDQLTVENWFLDQL